MSAEDPYVQQLAAELVVAETGMTTARALEALAFQDAASEVMDDIDRALGEESGGVWFEWSDHGVRLKIGVPSSLDPSSVGAAQEILERAELLDGTDFVEVSSSYRDLEAGQERVNDRLVALVPVSGIGTGLDPSTNCVVIWVPHDATDEQRKAVEEAMRTAGVHVRVEAGSTRASTA